MENLDNTGLDRRQKLRVWIVVLLLAAMVVGFISLLYQLQIVHGDEYQNTSTIQISTTKNVEAARGDILDRNGNILVTSRASYEVTLDYTTMGSSINDTLLQLIALCRANGIEWNDTLPISADAPFAYTTDSPMSGVTDNGDGTTTTYNTRLSKLCTAEKWNSDDSAADLMAEMRKTFSVDESLSDADARALVGIRYELELRRKEVINSTYTFASGISTDFIAQVKERDLRGVSIDTTTARQYNTTYAAHILGVVGAMSDTAWKSTYQYKDGYQMDDTVGRSGVESAFEQYLHGTDGEQLIETDTDGKTVSQSWITVPQPGEDVMLTIDIGLQGKVEDTLAQYVPTMNDGAASGAACVIVDVKSGEVLASASYPTYDLSTYNSDYTALSQDELTPLLNRATQGLYAPGSTFKPLTAIAALTEGVITTSSTVNCTGIYTFYSSPQPKCWIYSSTHSGHGLQNVTKAITNSCNVFFYDTGRRLGIDKLDEYASLFGLGQSTGIEISESTGVMAGPAYTESLGGTWYEGSTMYAAIGQESDQFTPLQLANYIATLVNGGTHYSAHLLKSVETSDDSATVYQPTDTVLNTIELDWSNINAIKQGMLDLTTSGDVASAFAGLDFKVGAKTGTAQLSASSSMTNAVFVCFAPYDDPQIAMALVVENGGHGAGLGVMAAQILQYYFHGDTADTTTADTAADASASSGTTSAASAASAASSASDASSASSDGNTGDTASDTGTGSAASDTAAASDAGTASDTAG